MKKALPAGWILSFLLLSLSVFPASPVFSQDAPTVDNLYMITMNGAAVTLDGELGDWNDAQWVFLSVDHPHYGISDAPENTMGYPGNAVTLSGWFAVKMDAENAYFAVRVRDEGVAMAAASAGPEATLSYDHLAVFLGLYDIGLGEYASPHAQYLDEGTGFSHRDPVTSASVYESSSYRIAPSYDNTGTTLGADHHIALRALPYSASAAIQPYGFGLVDDVIDGTNAASAKWSDGKGYNLEWKVPFSALAGKIANPAGPFANFEWPAFTPVDGMVIPMDASIGDYDSGDINTATQLVLGLNETNYMDASKIGYRGLIVDLSKSPNNVPRWTYPVAYNSPLEVTIDGDLSDWRDASFMGLSQDQPNWTVIQGTPQSPDDFSGYIGMKMDDDHLYFAVRARDGGTPMIETLATSNLAFNYDHLSVYLGLYDISDVPSNPHVEGPGEFELYRNRTVKSSTGADSTVTDTLNPTRTYRIGPGTDNAASTRGADFQILLRALPYGNEEIEATETYNGAYVDTTIFKGSTVAAVITDDESGYVMEWKVPFSSLAGDISKGSREFKGVQWPLFAPEHGMTISFDADITDKDDRDGARGQNRFLRLGDQPALWRDSKSFRMRGWVVDASIIGTSNEVEDGNRWIELPTSVVLSQNYPNPFNPSTVIEFGLATSSRLTLKVYDMLGKEIATLVDGHHAPGLHQVTFDASGLPSGTYVYQLTTGTQRLTRTLTLIK